MKMRLLGLWREWASPVVFALVLTQFGATAVGVDGASMMPALRHGERLVLPTAEGWAHRLGLGEYHQGDIVVFKPPREAEYEWRKDYRGLALPWRYRPYLVKRVVGVPGDTVSIQAGQVSVNGQPLLEEETHTYWNTYCPDTQSSLASSAAVPTLVPEKDLARANGLIGGVSQGAGLLGVLTGGYLVTAFSPALAIVLDGVSFVVMGALLLMVNLPPRELKTGAPESLLGSVMSGLRLMRRSRVLMFLPFIALLLNASLAPVQVLLPKLLLGGAGAEGYGQYLAAEGAGMLAASALLVLIGSRLPLRRTVTLGLALLGGPLFLLIQFATPPALLGVDALMGVAFASVNTPIITLMQQMVPVAFLGRTFSVLMTVATLGMPVTLLAISPVVDRYPAALFFTVAGSVTLLMALAWVWVALSERETPDLNAETQTIGAS